MYEYIKVAQVILMWHCAYARNTEANQSESRVSVRMTYGSAISRSVSLMILFGSAILKNRSLSRCEMGTMGSSAQD
jgi:hypothetical protein